MFNREKQRIKNSMAKDVGELMYSLSQKKQRGRPVLGK